jgi:hypothetical protein
LQCEELALSEFPILRSPTPPGVDPLQGLTSCHLSYTLALMAHTLLAIGKSRFGKSRFLMHCVTDLSRSRTPICGATCRHLRVRLNPLTPVLHSVPFILSGNRGSRFLHNALDSGNPESSNPDSSGSLATCPSDQRL